MFDLAELKQKALEMGFSNVRFTTADKLIVVEEYRKACEANVCGNYGLLKQCPPMCGTVAEMKKRFEKYKNVIILQTIVGPEDEALFKSEAAAKLENNKLAYSVIKYMKANGVKDLLLMSAGPWKEYSCASAYCVDIQKLSDEVGIDCWKNDGYYRYFSLVLY